MYPQRVLTLTRKVDECKPCHHLTARFPQHLRVARYQLPKCSGAS